MYTFLQNKYTECYFRIISNNRSDQGYKENHHIIPRSLGGLDDSNNIVALTAREHFICHLLLCKMVTGDAKRKMIYAANAVAYVRTNKHKLKITSRVFAQLRKELSSARTGVPRSDEFKRKLSEFRTGVPLSDKTKAAISAGTIRRYQKSPVSQITRDKISAIHKGKILSDETKRKIGESSIGRIQAGAKSWLLISPDGIDHSVYNLKGFCEELGVNWKVLANSTFGSPITKGKAKGWTVVRSS